MNPAQVKTLPISTTVAAKGASLLRVEELDQHLMQYNSATQALDVWCDLRGFSLRERSYAKRVDSIVALPPTYFVAALGLSDGEEIEYRKVQLMRDGLVLSEVENWYRPDALTIQMKECLAQTNVPFGRVVQALQFTRRTLQSEILWCPPEPMPYFVLRHHAVLHKPDSMPFSFVIETYTHHLLLDRTR
ncbi:hypothetical protein [Rhizobium rhizoryzae]|uniref:hypothetical protein n=1 Tax=Rhizobium rhizoryzae TaxID=451876 RepID=UPI0028B24289|nr:hypothetical protein [Rhizobium rhizoryzae]